MRGTRGRALAALLVLTACDLLQPTPDAALPIDELDVESRPAEVEPMGQAPTGPVMQIATGEVLGGRFHFVVHQTAGGVCSSLDWENGAGSACGALPGDAPRSEAFGMMLFGGDGVTQNVTGIVSAEVTDVWIELDSGERARAVVLPLDAADLEANAFMAFVPVAVGELVAVLALDGDGDLIERFEMSPAPPIDAAVPTPGAP